MNRAERRKAASLKEAPKREPKRVWLAIPNHDGGMKCLTATSILHDAIHMIMRGDTVYPFTELGHADLYLLRAQICARFLQDKEATDLVMIDNDVGWGPLGLMRLIDHEDVDIVAGAYPKRSDPLKFMWRSQANGKLVGDARTALMDVLGMPGGFMRIPRHVLEKMWEHYRAELGAYDAMLENSPGEVVRLFDPYWYVYEGKRLALSEDYAFCQRAIDMGFRVQMDAAIPMAHIGSKAWKGCVMEHLHPSDVEMKNEEENVEAA